MKKLILCAVLAAFTLGVALPVTEAAVRRAPTVGVVKKAKKKAKKHHKKKHRKHGKRKA